MRRKNWGSSLSLRVIEEEPFSQGSLSTAPSGIPSSAADFRSPQNASFNLNTDFTTGVLRSSIEHDDSSISQRYNSTQSNLTRSGQMSQSNSHISMTSHSSTASSSHKISTFKEFLRRGLRSSITKPFNFGTDSDSLRRSRRISQSHDNIVPSTSYAIMPPPPVPIPSRRTEPYACTENETFANKLKVTIIEAKGIPENKKYFCRLSYNHHRNETKKETSKKMKTNACLWSESHCDNNTPDLDKICIQLFRETSKGKEPREREIGNVEIVYSEFEGQKPVEQWYLLRPSEKSWQNRNQPTPSIRVKIHYMTLVILPLSYYNPLNQYLVNNYLTLCQTLEPLFNAKAKEDLASSLVKILHHDGSVNKFLCDILMLELEKLHDAQLMFRGNTFGSKSMEAFLKLVGNNYLKSTLEDCVCSLIDVGDCCEVDPDKLQNCTLEVTQQTLMRYTDHLWRQIVDSASFFPGEILHVFSLLRTRLRERNKEELVECLVSSCLFLRFLCPAVLSPSLFGLCEEMPAEPAARTLTLVAKSLQTLANSAKFGGKENYMSFMNEFVEFQAKSMETFLGDVSDRNGQFNSSKVKSEISVEVGPEFALIRLYLIDFLAALNVDDSMELDNLRSILADLDQKQMALKTRGSSFISNGPRNSSVPRQRHNSVNRRSEYDNINPMRHSDVSARVNVGVDDDGQPLDHWVVDENSTGGNAQLRRRITWNKLMDSPGAQQRQQSIQVCSGDLTSAFPFLDSTLTPQADRLLGSNGTPVGSPVNTPTSHNHFIYHDLTVKPVVIKHKSEDNNLNIRYIDEASTSEMSSPDSAKHASEQYRQLNHFRPSPSTSTSTATPSPYSSSTESSPFKQKQPNSGIFISNPNYENIPMPPRRRYPLNRRDHVMFAAKSLPEISLLVGGEKGPSSCEISSISSSNYSPPVSTDGYPSPSISPCPHSELPSAEEVLKLSPMRNTAKRINVETKAFSAMLPLTTSTPKRESPSLRKMNGIRQALSGLSRNYREKRNEKVLTFHSESFPEGFNLKSRRQLSVGHESFIEKFETGVNTAMSMQEIRHCERVAVEKELQTKYSTERSHLVEQVNKLRQKANEAELQGKRWKYKYEAIIPKLIEFQDTADRIKRLSEAVSETRRKENIIEEQKREIDSLKSAYHNLLSVMLHNYGVESQPPSPSIGMESVVRDEAINYDLVLPPKLINIPTNPQTGSSGSKTQEGSSSITSESDLSQNSSES